MDKVWYGDFTSEELVLLQELANAKSGGVLGHSVSEQTRTKISESNKGRVCTSPTRKRMSQAHLGKSPGEEHRRNLSQAGRSYWVGLSPEEVKEKLNNSLHSPEARRKASISRIGHFVSEETRQKIGKANMGNTYFAGKTHSEGARIEISKAHKGKVVSEATRKKISKACREAWISLPEEEKSRLTSKHRRGAQAKPNELESALDRFLQRRYPGEWAYNGDCSLGIVIGGKIPDFVNINGKKEVVEVLGGLGVHHFLGDDEKLVKHYAQYGFKCRIIWEWEVGDPEERERLLEEY